MGLLFFGSILYIALIKLKSVKTWDAWFFWQAIGIYGMTFLVMAILWDAGVIGNA